MSCVEVCGDMATPLAQWNERDVEPVEESARDIIIFVALYSIFERKASRRISILYEPVHIS